MDSVKEFLELAERGKTGKKVEKNDWDMDYIIDHVQDLVEEYDFSWDRQVIIPEDEKLFKDIFIAAKKLLLETGVYNMSTSRIITFTENEIDAGLKGMKSELTLGSGKDAYTLRPRKIEDAALPAIWAGSPGCPTPESMYYKNVLSSAKEPSIDLLTCGSLIDVDGYPVKNAEATEVLAVRRELEYMREAAEAVGRPGLGFLAAESAVTSVGDFAAVFENGLKPWDAHLTAMFNELIVDNDNLARTANKFHSGVKNASLACSMVGGLGGDAPGATIVMMASMMAANLILAADYHLCHPIHITDIATSARGCMWLQSVLCQSFAVNAPAIIVCDLWPASGAMTKELLYETAANAIVITVSGGHLEGVGSTNGSKPNGTGLEVRLMGEVGRAVAKQRMTRAEANAIVLKLLERYEMVFKDKDKYSGKPFNEAYDMETVTPVSEWLAMYEEVKEELVTLGVQL